MKTNKWNKSYNLKEWMAAQWLHNTYEAIAQTIGWKTQPKCKVRFDRLPSKNQQVMLELACELIKEIDSIIKNIKKKAPK